MTNLDALKNEGLIALNQPASSPAEKTIVVLGIARSGTSMVANVLHALGVPMGEKLSVVMEDVAISQAVEARDQAALRELVALRNARHPVWGWKRPSAFEHGEVWKDCFRNPYVVAIFRDPLAIANRNRISMLMEDVAHNLERSVQQTGALVGFLKAHAGPTLLCSYEKALIYPEAFVRAVDDFLGLKAADRWPQALAEMHPSPPRYLDASRVTYSLGHLDTVNDRLCSGWAFYPRQSGRSAKVQILVNDRLVHTVEARTPRPDVKEKGIHPTGLCGFRAEWPHGTAPRGGDKVEARVEGDIKGLDGSPRWLGAAGSA